jgi:hypothetical protein
VRQTGWFLSNIQMKNNGGTRKKQRKAKIMEGKKARSEEELD